MNTSKSFCLGILVMTLCSSFIEGKVSSQTTSIIQQTTQQDPEDNDIYLYVENPPKFPGGSTALANFINRNLKYPQKALENFTQGKVSVSFVVKKDGSISDIKVIKKVKDGLSEEAVRIIKAMPKWKPAVHHGLIVNAKYVLPIDFKLNLS
ncbi:energy transducer TonB [Solitalea sp. MAHUQ-68]|uniref:Energy transducer TonB n=1 Tax=Solitalea agri TaxID=2953739 RepID=A0A9X2F6V7_9SPHI|nr:energy transducer TonB [Solitalea agri]MCO4292953.1 energy transducer TonB [Solitalea agri]